MQLKYSHNNSGGSWWLTDDDWCKLELAGWKIDWYADRDEDYHGQYKDGRYLDALASNASKPVASKEAANDAIREFEQITGYAAEYYRHANQLAEALGECLRETHNGMKVEQRRAIYEEWKESR